MNRRGRCDSTAVPPNAVTSKQLSDGARSKPENALATGRANHCIRLGNAQWSVPTRTGDLRVPLLHYDPIRTVPSCSSAASARFIEACKFFQAR
jgi:hypothetical protein